MSTSFDLSKPNRPIHVGVILVDSLSSNPFLQQAFRITELLDIAVVDLLSGLDKSIAATFPDALMPPHVKAHALDVETHWVNQSGKTARLSGNISLQPTNDFTNCPPLDIVIMGANELGYKPSEAELEFVRRSYETCSAFITVCGGFEVPFAAGLFDGKTVTCPRPFLQNMRQAGPQTTWVEERWHRDGKLWTSGAVLNGLDLIRAFATEYWGGEGSLVEFFIGLGHFPKRDLNYADAEFAL
ncbi:hypothetical protein PV08_04874 [Exophiala spinifera]|uniref:DJ-1/PfpI domain-containing protein n=1 Tax=Exophiala spinifera TaxID=91928 RepID=A0A0D2C203_9EURO|nr:uncharacterized protein PV08_04874 [Exophiala spinifera]KIW17679.1 hypothetical protein PV08_04874 [Exophiala spinifera]